MEQILTTAALIAGGIFAVWILFTDPGGEDGKGEMNTALLGALLMIPVIILLIIGVVLFLPILLGIIVVLFLAYGAYLGLKWLLTRERAEKDERQEGKEGEERRLQKAFRNIREAFSSAWNSRPSRAVRERAKEAVITIRKTVKGTGGRLKTRVSERVREVRKSKEQAERVGTYEEQRDEQSSSASAENPSRKTANMRSRKNRSTERSHADDPLTNMRKIGWNTRGHLGEVYHHRRKSR